MPGERIVDFETGIVTSATSSQFISGSALKEEDGLFGPVRKGKLHWVMLGLPFSSERGDELGGVRLSAHSFTPPSNCTVDSRSKGGRVQAD